MFNAGIRGKRANDNQGTVNPQTQFVQSKNPQPYISGYTISGTDDTALDPAGGQTVLVNGTGFATGVSATVGGTQISVVTLVSPTQISFTSPAKSAGSYSLVVYNSSGGAGILVPGLTYSSVPTYTTAAGSIGSYYETTSISTSVVATSDSAITYSLASGSLPSGASLSSGGVITGTSPVDASSTTYTFAITATDAELQDVTRTFTLTINTDVVSWSSPANNTTTSTYVDQAISNVTLSANSAAGYGITYTANALPTGLSISGANIAGTPTVAASSSSLITATASTTNRTATRTLNWVVSFSYDPYFKNTTLLLNGETTVTPFISDASTNSFALTIAGDTKPATFNPYTPGYYSNYFDGAGDYLSTPFNSNICTWWDNNYTIECWIYNNTNNQSGTNGLPLQVSCGNPEAADTYWAFGTLSNGTLQFYYYNGTTVTNVVSTATIGVSTWTHIAMVYNNTSTNLTGYINGTQVFSVAKSGTPLNGSLQLNIGRVQATTYNGYISNLRIVKGTAVYTSAFTPSTTPLTAITNTSLLTCQSNRFIDNSTNNFTITKTGDTTISPNIPFTPNSSYSTYGSGYFDGTGDYLRVPYNAGFAMGSSNFTIEYWVYPTVLTGDITVLGAHTNDTNGGYGAGFNGTQPRTWINIGGGGANWNQVTGPIALLNTWNHIALVRNGSSFYMYTNGVQGTVYTNGGAISDASNSDVTIGARYNGTGNFYTGYVTDARIVKGTAVYTTAFTPPTSPLTAIANTSLLTLQYNGGGNNYGIIDNSNFNNIITRNGNASQGTFSPYSVTGWSNLFGTSDYFQLPTSTSAFQFLTNNFTIEGWVYLNSVVTGAQRMIWYNYQTSFTTDSIYFGGHPSFNGQIAFFAYNVNSSAPVLTDPTVLTPFEWTHLAVVRNGNNFTLYRNGVSVSTATSSASVVGNTWVYGGYIGTSSGGSLNGYLSNFRIVNGTAVYTANFTPPTAPLTTITGTALLICQSNRFVDNSPNNLALTVNGTPSVQALDPFGSIPEAVPISYSNYIDGTSNMNLLTTGSSLILSSNNWTIEAWIYLTTATTGSTMFYIASNRLLNGSNANGPLIGILNQKLYLRDASGSLYNTQPTTLSLGVWYHIAVCRSGSSIYSFINGVQEGTTYTYGSAPTYAGNQIAIGYEAQFGFTAVPGYISNLRIINGTALYTSAFTPSTTPLTAISNTSLLTCQSTTIKDNSTNAFTITVTSSPKVYNYNPFGYTAQTYTSYTPSLHGGSAYFDGTGDYLTVPDNVAFQFGTQDFTIEFWVYFNTVSSQQIVYDQRYTASTATPTIYINSSGVLIYYASGVNRITGATLVARTWYHVAVTKASGSTKLFINGTQSGSTYTDSITYVSGANRPIIGTDGSSVGSSSFTGYVSDLRVVKGFAIYTSNFVPPTQTLTNYSTTYPASLLLNMNNAGIIDQHSSNNHETVNNVQLSTAVKKYGNSSISFNGTNQQLTSYQVQNVQFGSGNWTVEFWAYFNSLAGAQVFANYGYDTATTRSWILYINAGVMRIAQSTDGSANVDASLGTPSLTTGAWYHFAFVRNSSVITLYVNGVSTGTTATAYNVAALSTSYYFKIGGDTTNFFNGYMDDFRITKGYARYTANFTPPTTALLTR